MDSVYEYHDYRVYLNSYYRQAKQRNPRFSTRVWVRQLGVKSPATISMILRDKRHPGPDLVEKLIAYFKFRDREARYFRQLILLAKTEPEDPRRKEYLRTIERLQRSQSTVTVELDAFELIANWYHFAIHQMLSLRSCQGSIDWIQRALRFPLGKTSLKRGLVRLVKSGLVQESRVDGYKVGAQDIATPNDVPSLAIREFHRQHLDLCKGALEDIPVEERYFGTTFFNVKSTQISALKRELDQIKSDLVQKYQCDDADETCSLSFTFFPITNAKSTSNHEGGCRAKISD